jgi:hypothetical protein
MDRVKKFMLKLFKKKPKIFNHQKSLKNHQKNLPGLAKIIFFTMKLKISAN